MNKNFVKLANEIIPSDDFLKRERECADKIFKLIQKESEFDVGRVCIAGSTGKKTTIISSDIDCVLFINNELPPFGDVLDDFENILTMADSFDIKNLRKTRFSIQFIALGFEFDILPAVNFTVGFQFNRKQLINIQQTRTLAHIKQDPERYGYSYSSSLADAAIHFMKRQDSFVHNMVRIAKFWYETLHFTDYVSGAKSCIEFIAVYAANQREKKKNRRRRKAHLRSFERFINYLQDFDNLDIHFQKNDRNDHQILDKSRPRVIDPVNPYNNLAKNWDPKSIELVKHYATETKRRLNYFRGKRMDSLYQIFRYELN